MCHRRGLLCSLTGTRKCRKLLIVLTSVLLWLLAVGCRVLILELLRGVQSTGSALNSCHLALIMRLGHSILSAVSAGKGRKLLLRYLTLMLQVVLILGLLLWTELCVLLGRQQLHLLGQLTGNTKSRCCRGIAELHRWRRRRCRFPTILHCAMFSNQLCGRRGLWLVDDVVLRAQRLRR